MIGIFANRLGEMLRSVDDSGLSPKSLSTCPSVVIKWLVLAISRMGWTKVRENI